MSHKTDNLSEVRSYSAIIPTVFLSFILISFFAAYLRTGFYADDFMQMGTFYHNAIPYGHTSITLGRYWANVFWGISTTAFGTTSDAPYLIFSTLIFFAGLYFIYLSIKPILELQYYLWALVILFASGCTLPLMLWASNNVHSMAILTISVGIFGFSKQFLYQRGVEIFSKYSIIESLTYSLMLFANPLYSPFLLIGIISCFLKLRQIRVKKRNFVSRIWMTYFLLMQIILPFTVLLTISIPQTLKNSAYKQSRLVYIWKNIQFYSDQIAPRHIVMFIYALIFFLGVLAFITAIVKRHWMAMLFFYLGFSILIPILMQQNQHFLNYLVMPIFTIVIGILLEFSFLRSSRESILNNYFTSISFIFVFIILFAGSTSVREWYIDYNAGYAIYKLRIEMSSLVPPNSNLCLEENLSTAQKSWLEGGLDYQWGLLHSPVNASSVVFASRSGCKPASGTSIIEVVSDTRGGFNAKLK